MQGLVHQAILGDLNTMAHGIARFSPKFCKDKMRFWSLGQSEAAFWDRAVFQVMDLDTVPEQDSNWLNRAQAGEGRGGKVCAIRRHKESLCRSALLVLKSLETAQCFFGLKSLRDEIAESFFHQCYQSA